MQIGGQVRSGSSGPQSLGIMANDDSTATISGGEFINRVDLVANDRSSIVLIGSTFNYPFGPISDTSGTITGTLSDGSSVGLDCTRV